MSTVDLWGAEAYLVMATPVALKHAIEIIIPIDVIIKKPLSVIFYHASLVSSIVPAFGPSPDAGL